MKEQSGWEWSAVMMLPRISVQTMKDYVEVSDYLLPKISYLLYCCRHIQNRNNISRKHSQCTMISQTSWATHALLVLPQATGEKNQKHLCQSRDLLRQLHSPRPPPRLFLQSIQCWRQYHWRWNRLRQSIAMKLCVNRLYLSQSH
jgi:hypothetical protein